MAALRAGDFAALQLLLKVSGAGPRGDGAAAAGPRLSAPALLPSPPGAVEGRRAAAVPGVLLQPARRARGAGSARLPRARRQRGGSGAGTAGPGRAGRPRAPEGGKEGRRERECAGPAHLGAAQALGKARGSAAAAETGRAR